MERFRDYSDWIADLTRYEDSSNLEFITTTTLKLLQWFGGKCRVRSAKNEECEKCGVWKMRSVENV